MKYKYIQLIFILTSFIIYFTLYSLYVTSTSYVTEDVTTFEICMAVYGVIISLILSYYLNKYVFNEDEKKYIIYIFIIGIISIVIVGTTVISNIYSIKNLPNPHWTKFNQIILPLFGGFILISEESIRHIFHWMFNKFNNGNSSEISNSTDSSD